MHHYVVTGTNRQGGRSVIFNIEAANRADARRVADWYFSGAPGEYDVTVLPLTQPPPPAP